MNTCELTAFMQMQIKEMEKYKWCLGIELGHDPLNDRSIEEIYCEWIARYSEEFRDRYNKEHEICK